MNRTFSIAGRSLLALGLLLLLQACASAPRKGLTLEDARASLQAEYPDLLESFDLHLGTFSVAPDVWDSLSPASRAAFVERCSEARRAITKRTAVRAEADGRLLVVYDGAATIYYDGTQVAAPEQELTSVSQGDSIAEGSVHLLSIPRPMYPTRALQAGVEGTVLVHACVGPDGYVQTIRVVDGGIEMLNGAALDAVRKARFRPFQGANEHDSVWVAIPMRFSILGEQRAIARASNAGPGASFGVEGSAELELALPSQGK